MVDYVGGELELFEAARNWKRYWSKTIRPYVGIDVLEVGAGIGSNVPFLMSASRQRWHCLEPDPQLCQRIVAKIEVGDLPRNCTVQTGTIDDVPESGQFDTILYIDVMEHIQDDRGEMAKAALRLREEGYVVVLSPAYQWLYTPFDAAIGHHRRYSRSTLEAIGADTPLQAVSIVYLDSAGLLASSANKLLLRKSMPNVRQVSLWDNLLVPLSRFLDPMLRYRVGKTVIAVWQKRSAASAGTIADQPALEARSLEH